MLYTLVKYLEQHFDIPGLGMFEYLSFRSVGAIILALLIGTIFGGRLIRILRRKQIGEDIRDLGLEGQMEKKGTPTMGGIVILISILVPILLLGDLSNIYVWLMIISTIWLGALGFADDYIKVFRKNKNGLKGKFKIVGQVGLGIIVGTVMCLSPQVVAVDKNTTSKTTEVVETIAPDGSVQKSVETYYVGEKSTKTTIPFVKDNEFDYHWFVPIDSPLGDTLTWVLYVLVAIFVITAVSNGSNLTDGLDGLNTGVSAIVAVVLSILAYLSGHVIYADYLNIMYIPDSGELAVFGAAFVGALIGFLWFNCYPAQVFMGDTGSLAIGGIIAVFALAIRKELLLPILCGIYLVEVISVMVQTFYFKYTRKRYGQGRRLFRMAPLHHHYQKSNIPENRIVVRFWIIQIILAAFALVTLKIR
ncbi:MAG: phospho-N-acetylmuramoyl-pentapeptide-transferase [Tidjanibacter sp.]|nr:phospho-N-acetylmuramoyl-pentapeptide-transferase [Tidjanibacter sp.]MBQ2247509.1 phospho-N-acetylmuramoyl-pentapeptide-transferase [Tidjanibacter sp.]